VGQVGLSGLSKVQYWLHPKDAPLPANDPYFTSAPWHDAQILAPPTHWGGGLSEDRLPEGTLGFEAGTGRPKSWPYATPSSTGPLCCVMCRRQLPPELRQP